MKREGTAAPDGDEPDKKKAAVSGVAARTRSATRAALVKLTDFPNEVLVRIYSLLALKDRQVTRRVGSRLLEFLDSSTPGADELQLVFRVTGSDSFSMKHSGLEDVVLRVDFARQPREGADVLSMLRSRLPPLRSIRPKKLDISPTRLLAPLMRLLVDQNVAPSVSSLQLIHSAPLAPPSEVQRAFAMFDRASQTGVQKLQLIGEPPLLSICSYLPRPVSITFSSMCRLRREHLQPFLQELRRLSRSRRTLRELLMGHLILFGLTGEVALLNTFATFSNLQELEFFFFKTENRFYQAFANMVTGMTSLLHLGTLSTPAVEFWEYLAERNIASHSLQTLKIGLDCELDSENLEAMVDGLQGFAPSLTSLCLDIGISFS